MSSSLYVMFFGDAGREKAIAQKPQAEQFCSSDTFIFEYFIN